MSFIKCSTCPCNVLRPCSCAEECPGGPSGDPHHPFLRPERARVVVVGVGKLGGRWGAGPDLDSAKRKFRQEGGILSRGYLIHRFTDDCVFAGITGMGGVAWFAAEGAQRPETEQVEAR